MDENMALPKTTTLETMKIFCLLRVKCLLIPSTDLKHISLFQNEILHFDSKEKS